MEIKLMTEPHEHLRQRDAVAQRRRRARITQRLIGVLYLGVALIVVVFASVTWAEGKLNPLNALIFALAVAGTLPIGILALQGDYLGTRSMDEGQREMSYAAQSDAFHVAYLGLYALFFGAILIPTFRDALPVAIGVLLLLATLTWVGGYMWRRWRP